VKKENLNSAAKPVNTAFKPCKLKLIGVIRNVLTYKDV